MRGRLMIVAAAAAAVVVAALAGGAAGTPTAGPLVKAAFNKTLKAQILVDSRGFTLYLYNADRYSRTPTCVDDATYHCSRAWPPLLATGKPRAGSGVRRRCSGRSSAPTGGCR